MFFNNEKSIFPNICLKLFSMNSESELDDIIVSGKISKEYLEIVKLFLERMKNLIPSECLYVLYNNIGGVSIKNKHTLRKSEKDTSYFDCINNKIRIKNSKTIWHELFHLSSGIYDQKNFVEYNGFRQTKYRPLFTDIGFGLNEGYTQLLTERYFKDKELNNDYNLEKIIANNLELLIGQSKMEQLYFKADLYGLVEELKNYIIEEEIYDFIKCVDHISEFQSAISNYKGKEYNIKMGELLELLRKINIFFIKVGFAKNQQIENSPFSVIESLTIDEKKYEITTRETVNNYYNLLANKYTKKDVNLDYFSSFKLSELTGLRKKK